MKKVFLIIVFILAVVNAFALNKIRWKQMDWYIYETQHFYLYYYKGEEFLAKLASVYAEQAYENDAATLHYSAKSKIPLFIYEDNQDFTATNITLDYLGAGVGGFTEPYKNRVVIPNTGSLKQFRQVIFHETTHAIQYDIMLGEGVRSYNAIYKELFVPTWVMEGMAEYDADDRGTEGDMVLRDAVINDRIVPINDMDAFDHLDEPYLAYKVAETMFDYISAKYGKDKVGKFIHYYGAELETEGVFKTVLNRTEDEFWKEFSFYLKKKYWAQVQGRDGPDKYGPRLTVSDHNDPVYNEAAEFSPDGNTLAYISTAAGSTDIYTMRQDGKESKRVFSGFDGIASESFPLSWAPDNKTLYFASLEKGRMQIFRGDTSTGSTEKIVIPGMTNVYGPAVSPDGNFLAFIGDENGFTDVYVCGIKGNTATNITGNVFENDFVSWAPDGNSLIFTEERDENRRIAMYDLRTGVKKFITKPAQHDYNYPRFIDENDIIYVSDETGIYNLYRMDLKTNIMTQLTNVVNGVFYPSVSRDYFAYTYYEDSCYNIFKFLRSKPAEIPEIPLIYTEIIPQKEEKNPVEPAPEPPKTQINPSVSAAGDDESFRKSVEEQSKNNIQSDTRYITSFSPDLILGILGFSSDTGLLGSGYLTFSDMLGNHNFALLANFVPGFYSQFDFSYMYLSLPFDVGFDVYYNQDVYQLYDTGTQTFFSQDNSSQVGGSMQLKYPFNVYTDLTIQIGVSKIIDRYTNYETLTDVIFPSNDDNVLNTIDIYFTSDHSAYRDLWPYSGDYFLVFMEAADKVFGGTETYNMYEIDMRKYIDLAFISSKNMSLAFRLMAAATDGPDRPGFLFGGETTVRGLDYGEYSGDKIGIFSAELRYTLARNINFNFWPFDFLMIKNIKVMLFNDMGIVRDDYISSVTNEELKNGMGAGVVIDTFILQREFAPVKIEAAKRTDNGTNEWNFYFSIATGF